jgi:hypothetical protein
MQTKFKESEMDDLRAPREEPVEERIRERVRSYHETCERGRHCFQEIRIECG